MVKIVKCTKGDMTNFNLIKNDPFTMLELPLWLATPGSCLRISISSP